MEQRVIDLRPQFESKRFINELKIKRAKLKRRAKIRKRIVKFVTISMVFVSLFYGLYSGWKYTQENPEKVKYDLEHRIHG